MNPVHLAIVFGSKPEEEVAVVIYRSNGQRDCPGMQSSDMSSV